MYYEDANVGQYYERNNEPALCGIIIEKRQLSDSGIIKVRSMLFPKNILTFILPYKKN